MSPSHVAYVKGYAFGRTIHRESVLVVGLVILKVWRVSGIRLFLLSVLEDPRKAWYEWD